MHRYLPPLPPRRLIGNNFAPDFIDARAKGLHSYIQKIFASSILLRSHILRDFLCTVSQSMSLTDIDISLSSSTQLKGTLSSSTTPSILSSSTSNTSDRRLLSAILSPTDGKMSTRSTATPSQFSHTLDILKITNSSHQKLRTSIQHTTEILSPPAASALSKTKQSTWSRFLYENIMKVSSNPHGGHHSKYTITTPLDSHDLIAEGYSWDNCSSTSSTSSNEEAGEHFLIERDLTVADGTSNDSSIQPIASPLNKFRIHALVGSALTSASSSCCSLLYSDPTPSQPSNLSSPHPTSFSRHITPKNPNAVSLKDFYLLKLIGRGNFGKVMLSQHKTTNQVYAIKVISKSQVCVQTSTALPTPSPPSARKQYGPNCSPNSVGHIMAERNVLIRALHHPFLVGLCWAFQTREKLYFVTDYINGGDLFFHLQNERRFGELRARFYIAEIVSAIEYLHMADIVFRDLKPENILINSDGHVKLTDFGLAKENLRRENSGTTQTFCGTPEYLAPEVLRQEPYGFPVDWWCLGAVLYEMLVGLPPFFSKNADEMCKMILKEKLRFPPYVGARARTIISGVGSCGFILFIFLVVAPISQLSSWHRH